MRTLIYILLVSVTLSSAVPTGQEEKNDNFLSHLKCPPAPENMTHCRFVDEEQFDRRNVHQKNMWIALSRIGCHEELNRLLCSIYSPVCRKSHRTANILPCQEFCTSVHDKCIEVMKNFGFLWPQSMECSSFPAKNESMCVPQNPHENIKCTPCEEDMRAINLQELFCKSNVVLVAQLLQYRNFEVSQGIQNVRLTLGPRTKPLRLIKRDGNFTNVSKQLNFRYEAGYQRYRRQHHNFYQSQNTRPMQRRRRFKRSLSISDYRKMNDQQGGSRRSDNFISISPNPTIENHGNMTSDSGNMNGPLNNRRRISRRIKSVRNRRDSRVFNLDGVSELNIDCSVCSKLQGLSNSDRWLVMGERIRSDDGHLTSIVKVRFLVQLSRENGFLRQFIRYWRNQSQCPTQG